MRVLLCPNTMVLLSALSVVGVIFIDYKKSKRIRMISTSAFEGILMVALFYILAEMSTVYTLLYLKDSWINEVCHRMFYFLLLSSVFSFSVYVEILGNLRNKKLPLWLVALWILPYMICSAGVFLGKIHYVVDAKGIYSYGMATNFIYVGMWTYLVIIFIDTFRYRQWIAPKKQFALRLQLGIWTAVAIIHILNSYILFASVGIALSVMALYLAFENPNENLDEDTGAFTRKAFMEVFYEKTNCMGAKSQNLICLVVEDRDIVISNIGYYRYEEIVRQLVQYMQDIFGEPIYRLRTGMLVTLYPAKYKDYETKLKALEEKVQGPLRTEDTSISLKTHAVVMECPKFTNESTEVFNLVSCGSNYGGNGFVRPVDELIVKKKKREDAVNRLLSEAISKDGFEVVYQPIYSVAEKAFVSAEALVRLKDKETLGYVSPEEFVPLAEKNGYVIKIGEIVFEKVCETIAELHQRGLGISYVEVNLSALQGIDEQVPEVFATIMKKYAIDTGKINLEITETTVVESASLLDKNMKTFREMGCSFSMDDFGTGYSNLSQMAEVQYDLVKIDKSLIWPCFEEQSREKSHMILNSVMQMVSHLDSRIVAEGIETEEMARTMMDMGVHYLQGFYFAKPLSKAEFFAFLEEKKEYPF